LPSSCRPKNARTSRRRYCAIAALASAAIPEARPLGLSRSGRQKFAKQAIERSRGLDGGLVQTVGHDLEPGAGDGLGDRLGAGGVPGPRRRSPGPSVILQASESNP
jgi:hypothetical protein